jgi:hypothetical protein
MTTQKPSNREMTMKIAVRRGLAAIATAAALAAVNAAPAVADASSCTDPALTQAFARWGDSNWYALVGGQTPGNFDGAGWTLSGGATITPTTLADGSFATVLDVPAGGKAVSPVACVDPTYTSARTMLRRSEGWPTLSVTVSYRDGSGNWADSALTAELYGRSWWHPSASFPLQPPDTSGWQLARFTFTGTGYFDGDSQIYNLYVDPYSRG